MYLHLGSDVIIKKQEIVGIFDIDKTTISKRTRDFLSEKEKQGKIINVTNELPKAFIVSKRGDDIVAYISQISTATLLKRCEFIQNISYI